MNNEQPVDKNKRVIFYIILTAVGIYSAQKIGAELGHFNDGDFIAARSGLDKHIDLTQTSPLQQIDFVKLYKQLKDFGDLAGVQFKIEKCSPTLKTNNAISYTFTMRDGSQQVCSFNLSEEDLNTLMQRLEGGETSASLLNDAQGMIKSGAISDIQVNNKAFVNLLGYPPKVDAVAMNGVNVTNHYGTVALPKTLGVSK